MSDQVIPRSIYKINPLMTVVCQFRFPPILTIDTEVPSKFQEKIRTKFPQYSEVPGFAQQLVPMSFPNINNPPLFGQPSIKNHQFLSSDNDLVVNLTRTFITLQTSKYKSWEPFIENFKFILSSLVETYRPAYFTRIGLRYINLLNRSKLGLANTRWKELIQPAYLGLLSTSINDKIKSFDSTYEIKLDDDASFKRLKLAIGGPTINIIVEECFMVDTDFYNTQRLESEEALIKLEYLNKNASIQFREIIQDKLDKAMKQEIL